MNLEKFHKAMLKVLGKSTSKSFKSKDSYFKQVKVEALIFDYEKAVKELIGNPTFAVKLLKKMQTDIFSKPDGLVYKLIKSY